MMITTQSHKQINNNSNNTNNSPYKYDRVRQHGTCMIGVNLGPGSSQSGKSLRLKIASKTATLAPGNNKIGGDQTGTLLVNMQRRRDSFQPENDPGLMSSND
jgi:hypothetical protein